MTEKIQIFMSDLAYKLQVGEIKEIHIAEQNGQKVLRIECETMKKSEYKTIKATKTPKPNQCQHQAKEPAKPVTLSEKLVAGAKDFLFNPKYKNRKGKKDPFGNMSMGKNRSLTGLTFDSEPFGGREFGGDGRFG
jgi:hypothetical protein